MICPGTAPRFEKARGIILPELYDPFALSEDERSRFFAALGDGFSDGGNSFGRVGLFDEVALPARIEVGLLKHRAFYDWTARTESRSDEKKENFWIDCDDEPGLFRLCPIRYDFERIGDYFEEQKRAYIQYAVTTDDYKQEAEKEGFFSNELLPWGRHFTSESLRIPIQRRGMKN
jgi:hypothetical protein